MSNLSKEYKIGNYKNMIIEVQRTEMTDDQLSERVSDKIAELCESFMQYEEVDRPTKMGDLVVLDYTGFCGGEQFEGGTANGAQLLLGSGMFIEGFEEQLVGKERETVCYVNVTFPEEYHMESLAGKAACFMCTIHQVYEGVVPELTDELANRAGFESVRAMVAKAGESVQAELETSMQYDIENAICPRLVDLFEGTVPEEMIDAQCDKLVEQFANTLQSQGMNLHDFLQEVDISIDALKANYRNNAINSCKLELALALIAELEGFTVSPAEMEEEYRQLSIAYALTIDDTHALIGDEDLHKELLQQKVLDFIRNISAIRYI